MASSWSTFIGAVPLFEGLYGYDPLARPVKLVPVSASSMPDVSADFRTWTIRLKPGIRFTDDPAFKGMPRELVAEDFVYSIKRYADPAVKSPLWNTIEQAKFKGLLALREEAIVSKRPFDYDRPIEGLRAIDRHTLQLKVEDPRPRLGMSLIGFSTNAVAREVVEFYGAAIAEHPVGTGPFRLTQWRRSSLIVLERNPLYRDDHLKALLDIFGYVDINGDGWRERPDGTPLILEVASETDGNSRQYDELMQRNMKEIGLRIRFKVAQWPENAKAARAGKLMMWTQGYGSTAPDGLAAIERLYGPAAGGANLSRFRLPAMDALYARLLALPDGPERLQAFHEAKQLAVATCRRRQRSIASSAT